MTLTEKLNRISPKYCRFLARKDLGRRPMTNDDIAKAGGLSRSSVAKISKLDSWDTCTLKMIESFSRGCGVDLLAPSKRRDKRLVAAGRMTLFSNSTPAQRRMYSRLLNGFGGNHHNDRGLDA